MDFLAQIRDPELPGFALSLGLAAILLALCWLLSGLDATAPTLFSAPVAAGLVVFVFLWRQSGLFGMYLGVLATLGLVIGTLLLALIPHFLPRVVVLAAMSPWAWEPFHRKHGRGLDTMLLVSWIASGAHALAVVALPATPLVDADNPLLLLLAVFVPMGLWIWFAASTNLTTQRVWKRKRRSR